MNNIADALTAALGEVTNLYKSSGYFFIITGLITTNDGCSQDLLRWEDFEYFEKILKKIYKKWNILAYSTKVYQTVLYLFAHLDDKRKILGNLERAIENSHRNS